jgi:flagellar basal-body rod protein FlgC
MDLKTSMAIAASGLTAQSARMRVIAENLANADSTATTPGGTPYRRQVPTISSQFSQQLDATVVKAGAPVPDQSPFRTKYDPGNPAANAKGYVTLPNVNPLIEIMDMREAQRSYQADLTVMDASKTMLSQTINLLTK